MATRSLTALLVAAAACVREPPRAEPPAEDLRRLAAALDVVATDYPRLDREPAGHQRLREMLHAAEGYARRVPGGDAVREVAALVEARAGHELVAAAARGLRRRIVTAHGPIAAPVRAPSRERAQKLWTMLCVGCHGTGGLGDGPQGLGLTPEPRSFRDPEVMRHLSPLRAYSAITDGISGTAMPAWGTFTSEERWGLAFLVFGLRHAPAAVERGAAAHARARGSPAASPTRLAPLTDGELTELLEARGLAPDEALDALAFLRTRAAFELPPSRLGAARRELASALARNRLDREGAVAALDQASQRLFPALAMPLELGRRCGRLLADARALASDGVLDETLERALRHVSICLDDAEEWLGR